MISEHNHDQRNAGDTREPTPITDVPHRDIARLMLPGAERRQSMRGFDEDYVDIVDYIVRCTHKIWEEHGIGLIYTHYQHNVVIHTSDGITYGRDKVIADSIKTMAAFPDARVNVDHICWLGDEQAGYRVAVRWTLQGTHEGPGVYGAPSGRRVRLLGISHYVVKDGKFVKEWTAFDEFALLKQIYAPESV